MSGNFCSPPFFFCTLGQSEGKTRAGVKCPPSDLSHSDVWKSLSYGDQSDSFQEALTDYYIFQLRWLWWHLWNFSCINNRHKSAEVNRWLAVSFMGQSSKIFLVEVTESLKYHWVWLSVWLNVGGGAVGVKWSIQCHGHGCHSTKPPALHFIQSDMDSVCDFREGRAYKLRTTAFHPACPFFE